MDNSGGAPDGTAAPEDTARRLKDSTARVVDHTKQVAKEKAEASAVRAGATVQDAATALRRVADDVQGDHAWMGSALRKSAEGLEAASDSLSGGDVSRALSNLDGFARRQPAVFLGASLALGFALARVGKTAIERASPADGNSPPEI